MPGYLLGRHCRFLRRDSAEGNTFILALSSVVLDKERSIEPLAMKKALPKFSQL